MQAAKALASGMKRLRRRLGMTQAQLAEAADLHVQYVSQVERLARSPSMETIDAIADALGVTPAELFALGEGHRASPPAEVAEVVDTLLSTWSAKDQVRLVGILRELHAVAGRRR
ncbi:MAG: helix-turn-helix domain-containing protein [Sandaracinaceae bacterium]|nr:helix-turn-helix domain-containing protein [Sandaracinaceae bacterium]